MMVHDGSCAIPSGCVMKRTQKPVFRGSDFAGLADHQLEDPSIFAPMKSWERFSTGGASICHRSLCRSLFSVPFPLKGAHTINWLVVWNMTFIFPNSWDDDPI
jgi:hypothetical protein